MDGAASGLQGDFFAGQGIAVSVAQGDGDGGTVGAVGDDPEGIGRDAAGAGCGVARRSGEPGVVEHVVADGAAGAGVGGGQVAFVEYVRGIGRAVGAAPVVAHGVDTGGVAVVVDDGAVGVVGEGVAAEDAAGGVAEVDADVVGIDGAVDYLDEAVIGGDAGADVISDGGVVDGKHAVLDEDGTVDVAGVGDVYVGEAALRFAEAVVDEDALPGQAGLVGAGEGDGVLSRAFGDEAARYDPDVGPFVHQEGDAGVDGEDGVVVALEGDAAEVADYFVGDVVGEPALVEVDDAAADGARPHFDDVFGVAGEGVAVAEAEHGGDVEHEGGLGAIGDGEVGQGEGVGIVVVHANVDAVPVAVAHGDVVEHGPGPDAGVGGVHLEGAGIGGVGVGGLAAVFEDEVAHYGFLDGDAAAADVDAAPRGVGVLGGDGDGVGFGAEGQEAGVLHPDLVGAAHGDVCAGGEGESGTVADGHVVGDVQVARKGGVGFDDVGDVARATVGWSGLGGDEGAAGEGQGQQA